MARDLPPVRPAAHRQPLSWPLVVGLGSLALLWPLGELTGVPEAIGRLGTFLLNAGVVAVVWIVGVGLGRAHRGPSSP